LLYGDCVREIRRSFRCSIDGSTRVVLNSLSPSEETASGNRKRNHDGESIGYFSHSATSLKSKQILASERSCVRGGFTPLATTCHEFFSRSPSVCNSAVQR